jgi:hypothetical protein
MNKDLLLIIGSFAAVQFAVADDPGKIRPGLWETTSTSVTSVAGQPLGPDAATLAAMPPDQRAKVEELMKRATAPKTSTQRSCVTPEQAAKGLLSLSHDDSPRCKTETLERTSSDLHFRQQCAETTGTGKGSSNAEVKIHLNSPESATVVVDAVSNADGRTMTINSNSVAKWVSADCGKEQSK